MKLTGHKLQFSHKTHTPRFDHFRQTCATFMISEKLCFFSFSLSSFCSTDVSKVAFTPLIYIYICIKKEKSASAWLSVFVLFCPNINVLLKAETF